MNQLYKKNEYIVIPVENNYVVINTGKIFKEGHCHIKELPICRLLIDLAIRKELPKNPKFIKSLIRISTDKEYIKELEQFKEDNEEVDVKDLMKHDSYKRVNGAIRRR